MGYGRDGLAETGQWGQDLKTTFTSGSCLYFVLFFFGSAATRGVPIHTVIDRATTAVMFSLL